MDHQEIVGKNFKFIYSDETYLIEVISKTSVRWTRELGKNKNQSDTEQYVFSNLTDDIFMLTWVEADGLCLSNVLRLNDNTLITHANVGRDVFVNAGILMVIK